MIPCDDKTYYHFKVPVKSQCSAQEFNRQPLTPNSGKCLRSNLRESWSTLSCVNEREERFRLCRDVLLWEWKRKETIPRYCGSEIEQREQWAESATWQRALTRCRTHPCSQTAATLVVTVLLLRAIIFLPHKPVVDSFPRQTGINYKTVAWKTKKQPYLKLISHVFPPVSPSPESPTLLEPTLETDPLFKIVLSKHKNWNIYDEKSVRLPSGLSLGLQIAAWETERIQCYSKVSQPLRHCNYSICNCSQEYQTYHVWSAVYPFLCIELEIKTIRWM